MACPQEALLFYSYIVDCILEMPVPKENELVVARLRPDEFRRLNEDMVDIVNICEKGSQSLSEQNFHGIRWFPNLGVIVVRTQTNEVAKGVRSVFAGYSRVVMFR